MHILYTQPHSIARTETHSHTHTHSTHTHVSTFRASVGKRILSTNSICKYDEFTRVYGYKFRRSFLIIYIFKIQKPSGYLRAEKSDIPKYACRTYLYIFMRQNIFHSIAARI